MRHIEFPRTPTTPARGTGDDKSSAQTSVIPAPASPSGADNFARALLLSMASGNCDTAKRFIQIGRLDLARHHLVGALKQLGQAEERQGNGEVVEV